MKAIVLVGGEGTRLRPLTLTTPKPLLPIANVAFLERQLAWLAGFGVDEAILSMGYLPDAFRAHFDGDQFNGMRLRYAVEEKPLGTAGGIRFAAEGINERVVVCNGDVLTALDLGAMLEFHEQRGAQASIYLCRVDDPSMFGVVPTRDDGEVIGFIEKPPRDQAPTNWINAGTYILEPSVFDRIPSRVNVSIERETFPRMVEMRGALYAFAYDGYWLDIGTPEKYLQAHTDILAGALGGAPTSSARELRPGIWVEGEANVHSDAQLHAPMLIGSGASIEAGASLTNSVIGAGASIGAGANLLRAVVHSGAQIGERAEVVDSVIGVGARLGAESGCDDTTLVGAQATLDAATRLSGGRVAADA